MSSSSEARSLQNTSQVQGFSQVHILLNDSIYIAIVVKKLKKGKAQNITCNVNFYTQDCQVKATHIMASYRSRRLQEI